MNRAGQTLEGNHGSIDMVLHVLESKIVSFGDNDLNSGMWQHSCIDLLGSRLGCVFHFYEGFKLTLEKRGWRRLEGDPVLAGRGQVWEMNVGNDDEMQNVVVARMGRRINARLERVLIIVSPATESWTEGVIAPWYTDWFDKNARRSRRLA